MSKRKTILVADLRDMANTYIENTDDLALKGSAYNSDGTQTYSARDWRMMRLGVCQLLESALHKTGNYRGYSYRTDYHIDESSRHYG